MLTFLQPILLWASAAIIIPVLIHLWNVKQGKTLKVGSIVFFAKSATSHNKSIRIKDWLLLLLRCLLILLLAILMAKPSWKQETKAKEKGWILVEKENLQQTYSTCHTVIDTFLQQGYAIHYFDENFEKAEPADTLRKAKDTMQNNALPYWTLLKLVNQKLPAGFPVQLFTRNDLKRFAGNRPDVALRLTWHIIPAADSSAIWLEKAYLTSTDSLWIVKGESHLYSTVFTHQNLSLQNGNDAYTINHHGSELSVTNPAKQTVNADTATMIIAIYENGSADDAAYVEAALTAIRDATQRRIRIVVTDKRENIPPDAGWLFWLSDDSLPSIQNTKLFVYEKGKTKTMYSDLLANNEQILATAQNIALYKYIQSNTDSFQTIWENGYGEPLLTRQNGHSSVYHFYSRFSPQWSDLVWNAGFPQLLYDIMFSESNNNNKANNIQDKRIIDSSQIEPQFVSTKYMNNSADLFTETDLSGWLWIAAFLVFLTERILSFRKRSVQQS